jgi:CopG family nickel-responsive transcriptional regulator
MQRITVSIDDALSDEFDVMAKARGYQSRSEAIRDLMRGATNAHRQQASGGHCVASLSYIYNHHTRILATRLMDMQHGHHDLVLATTHVHLDHDHCLETVLLSGAATQVRAFADEIQAERGVRYSSLNMIPVEPTLHDPADSGGHHHHANTPHLSPRGG